MAINRAFFSVLHMLYYRVICCCVSYHHSSIKLILLSMRLSGASLDGLLYRVSWKFVKGRQNLWVTELHKALLYDTCVIVSITEHIRSTCEWYKRRHWSTVYVEYGLILTSSSIYPLSSDSPLGFGNEKSFELGVAALVFHLLTYSDSTGYSMLQTQLGETMISPHYHHTAGPPHNSCVQVCFS